MKKNITYPMKTLKRILKIVKDQLTSLLKNSNKEKQHTDIPEQLQLKLED